MRMQADHNDFRGMRPDTPDGKRSISNRRFVTYCVRATRSGGNAQHELQLGHPRERAVHDLPEIANLASDHA